MNNVQLGVGLALVTTFTLAGCHQEEPHAAVAPAGTITADPWWMNQPADDGANATLPVLARDPFSRGSDVVDPDERIGSGPRLPSAPAVTLQGVVAWDGTTVAVIDGKQYRLGEVITHRLREWKIVGVDADLPSVTLRWTDGEHEVDATVFSPPVD